MASVLALALGVLAPAAQATAPSAAVFSWGFNAYGALGDGTNTDSLVPVSVLTSGALAGKTVTSIAGGSGNACALTDDGAAYCWGTTHVGSTAPVPSNAPVAVDMSGVLAGKRIKQISINFSATCALTTDSVVACWGDNSPWGSLGDNHAETSSLIPVLVDASGVLLGHTISSLSVGGFGSTCAVLDNGGAACWGAGNRGTLGYGAAGDSPVPVLVDMSGVLAGKHISAIGAGALHMCATTLEGVAACWGYDSAGQVGNGSHGTDVLAPVLVDTTGPLAGKTVTQIAAGGSSSCALTSDGLVSCWGAGVEGALGAGNNSDSYTPQAVDTSGVLSGQRVTNLAMGSYTHTCVITAANLVSCWGAGTLGELGNGVAASTNAPTAVVQGGALAGRDVMAIAGSDYDTYVLTGAPEDQSQFPTAAMQAFGRAPDGTCARNAPEWVNWPGLAGQQFNSWGLSWQQWPNNGTGGFVCERQPYYVGHGWGVK